MERPSPTLNSSGFSLLEALVTGAIAMIVIMGFLALNSYFTEQQRATQLKTNAQDFHKKVEAIVNQRATEILQNPPGSTPSH